MRRHDTPLAGATLALAALVADDAPKRPPAELRAERIAGSLPELEAQAAGAEAFGGDAEFRAALESIAAGAEATSEERWWRVEDGAIPLSSVRSWLRWNRPDEGRTLAAALDYELAGHPRHAIVDLARQLAARDVEFLFVTFPTRIQCYPGIVAPELEARAAAPGAAPFHGMVAAHARFMLDLAKAGVEVIDLAPRFIAQRYDESDERRRLLYHRWNFHWTPRAAELAAQAVAERIARMPWFEPGPYKEGRSFDVRPRKFKFQADGNGQAPDSAEEPMAVNGVHLRGRPLGKDAIRGGPIVLLGDSFVEFHMDWSGAFKDQLLRFTGWPIDVVAPLAGGAFTCRDTLRRRGDALAGKKVVVWMVATTVLEPSDDFRPIDLFENP